MHELITAMLLSESVFINDLPDAEEKPTVQKSLALIMLKCLFCNMPKQIILLLVRPDRVGEDAAWQCPRRALRLSAHKDTEAHPITRQGTERARGPE